MLRVRRSWLLRYGVAVVAVTLALLLKLLLAPLLETESPFLLFFAAVMISTWYGGRGPGLLAIALATLVSDYFFLSPLYSLFEHSLGQSLRLGLFVLEGGLISWLVAALQTAKRQAEVSTLETQRHLETLRQSEARFGSIAQSNLIGIFFADLRGNITKANDTFLKTVGYTQEDLLAGNLHWSDMTPPEYLPQDEQAIAELRESGVCIPFEKEYIRKDGSRVPILLGAAFLEGSQHDCVCFALDITQGQQAEEALRESEARFRVMADTAPVLIWMAGPDKLCDYFNQTWLDFTGRTPEQEFGSGWLEGIHPEDLQQFWQTYINAFDAHRTFTMEYRLRRFDGEYRWILDTGVPRFVPDGGFVGYIGSAIDITERKQAEQEREEFLTREQAARTEAETANRMKDEFLATLSHELRTPLNAMLGWTQLLRTRKLDQVTYARALETVDRNTRSLASLIEDVLDVSRIIRGQLRLNVRPVQLVSVVEAAIDAVCPAAEAKAIRLQSVLDPATGPVAGDSDRLQQIVWNLLSNAIKFTPKEGRVQVLLEQINSHVELTVSDTGKGISAEFLPYVFERFRQADSTTTRTHSGLGLGLAIVRHLVELHGGTVHAESSGEGQGAMFIVKLPLMPVRLDTSDSERVHPKAGHGVPFENLPVLSGLRVLVVDDEADAREFITTVLEQCGAAVTAIASAKEALEALTRSKLDVLVSDIGMPGEDGYALISKVRSLAPEQGGRIPAAALTAYAREEDRTQALLAGFQLHASKPVSPAELAAVVANLAGRTRNG